MTQVPILPIKTSSFHFPATPITVEVGDVPELGMQVPLNGKTDVRLEVTPILLVSGDAKPRLLNGTTVTHELQQRGQVASFIAYEVSCDSLPAGSERCLEWIYCKVQPCYLLPQEHKTTRKRRETAISILMEDPLLQQFIKEEVLLGADPLMPSTLRQLFNKRLSKSTFEQDLKKIRQKKAHQATPAPEHSPPKEPSAAPKTDNTLQTPTSEDDPSPMPPDQKPLCDQSEQGHGEPENAPETEQASSQAAATPPDYSVQPDDDTLPGHDGSLTSQQDNLPAIEENHCTRRYAPYWKRQEREHARRKALHAFGASRLHRRVGRDPGTVLREKLGINTSKH